MEEKFSFSVIPVIAVLFVSAGVFWLVRSTDGVDHSFDAQVPHPAFPTSHPRVYFDTARWNSDLYEPFLRLIRSDGYKVDSKSGPITPQSLEGHNVLVLANALGFMDGSKHVPGLRHHMQGDAFTTAEATTIRDWVHNGGSLLLATDYAPTAKRADRLADEFGITLRDGYAVEPKFHDPTGRKWGFVVFSREDGLLLDHPITRGRNGEERLAKVETFSGQCMSYPPSAVPFLRLSADARTYPYRQGVTPREEDFQSAAGAAEGVAMEVGKGRVVIVSDGATLTSQLTRVAGRNLEYGMSHDHADDRQLALNIMHWLSRALN